MEPVSPDQRKSALAAAVRAEIMKGGVVQSQSEFDAVILFGKATPFWHWILTALTCGAWLPVVVILLIVNRRRRLMLFVDEYGNVSSQAAKAAYQGVSAR